jgi:hypothetical protein
LCIWRQKHPVFEKLCLDKTKTIHNAHNNIHAYSRYLACWSNAHKSSGKIGYKKRNSSA